MRKQLIVAGIAAATLIPTFAFAQQSCEERRNNRVAGTVVGGVLGALAGSAVAGRGDRNEGAVIGGVGGAVIGNQVSKGNGDCQRAYGYYDNSNQWHANSVNREMAPLLRLRTMRRSSHSPRARMSCGASRQSERQA